MGETGIAVGYEKMRDAEGKMDGKLIGQVLGYFSHPDERAGKVFVFPHIFAEVMRDYMDAYGVTERDLAAIAVQEYANARFNPCAQMNKVQITLDQALKIEGFNRYVVEGLPHKTYDCSQITDGYASLILDRKSTRLNSSHLVISYAVFCLKKKQSHETNGAIGRAAIRGPRSGALRSTP